MASRPDGNRSTSEEHDIAAPSHTHWFTRGRLGLFVHFGVYSMLARHEWVMSREQIPVEEYERLAELFEPDQFDAAEIARLAKRAGMAYVVVTAKHHEGFALWDTALSPYNATRLTGRDLLGELTSAVRAEGLKVGVYFSLIDWHHPDFTVDYHHPLRAVAQLENAGRDMSRYRDYLHGQVREVLTRYGRIDYLFYDYTYPESVGGMPGKGPEDWDADGLLAMTRELQPGIVVNDRLGIAADVVTPEQYQPSGPIMADGAPVVWEACQTLNGSWGYDRDNETRKPSDLIVRMLVDTVAKGGNMLLNIAPDGRGAVTAPDRACVQAVGEWMRLHSRAVVDAGPAAVPAPPGCVLTAREDRLYVHVLTWPFEHLHIPHLAGRVRIARFLHDGSEVRTTVLDPEQAAWNTVPGGQAAGTLTLLLPVARPDVAVPVVELVLTAPLEVAGSDRPPAVPRCEQTA